MTASTQLSPDVHATLGWPVFPCRPGSKEPATRHGFKDASTDPTEVAAMFAGRDDLNVAMATGCRLDVLDFDVKPERDGHPAVDARPWVHKLNAAGLLAGAVGIAETRNGGLHLFYPASGLSCGSLAREGIDFKALGGYVLIPPSRVPSDFADLPGAYRWVEFPGSTGRPLDWQAPTRRPRACCTSSSRPGRVSAITACSGLRAARSRRASSTTSATTWCSVLSARACRTRRCCGRSGRPSPPRGVALMVQSLSDIRDTGPPPALLDRVEAFVRRFLVLPNEHAYVAVALWVAHCWVLDGFDTSPRLAFLSPEPGSGKSRAQDVLALLVPRPLRAINVSVPVLFRSMVDEHNEPVAPPTIFLDEVDAIFGPKAKGDDEPLRAFANAGHTRGVLVQRIANRGNRHVVETFPAFAPMSLAGLKDLPQTVMDRSVVVRMARTAPGEVVAKFREKYARAEAEQLRTELLAWGTGVDREALDLAEDDMPDCLENRQGDVWEPLIACADAVGGRWPDRARGAAVAFTTTTPGGEESLGVRLLADLQTVFGTTPALATADVLKALHDLDESPWADLYGKPLDARGLAKRLRAFEVQSKTVRIGATTHKGYERTALLDQWTRYLTPLPTCAGCGETLAEDLNGDGLHPTCTPTERTAS